jgi:hypothetical protein
VTRAALARALAMAAFTLLGVAAVLGWNGHAWWALGFTAGFVILRVSGRLVEGGGGV